jgi:hypothetical protein
VRLAALAFVISIAAANGGCHASPPEPTGTAPALGTQDDATAAATMGPDHATGSAAAPSVAEDRTFPEGPLWAPWPMPNSASAGLPNAQTYDTGVTGVVLDRITGLMWQRAVDDGNGTFHDAQAQCARLDLAGHRDWRLPSRIELVSILDLGQSQPSISPVAFPKTPSDWFWTSSLASDSPTAAWYVYFYFGYPKTDEQSNRFRVRCVRTAKPPKVSPSPEPPYDVAPQVVRDRGTGLSWQRMLDPRTFDFVGAQHYCARLDLDGHKDWRAPSMPELLTLIDERASSPTIDIHAFPGTPGDSFWTSSLFVNAPAEAWHVYFDHGNSLYGLLKGAYRVRCVR